MLTRMLLMSNFRISNSWMYLSFHMLMGKLSNLVKPSLSKLMRLFNGDLLVRILRLFRNLNKNHKLSKKFKNKSFIFLRVLNKKVILKSSYMKMLYLKYKNWHLCKQTLWQNKMINNKVQKLEVIIMISLNNHPRI